MVSSSRGSLALAAIVLLLLIWRSADASASLKRPQVKRHPLARPRIARPPTVGTIVEMRSVSIARKWIGLGCVTDMERLSAVTVVR